MQEFLDSKSDALKSAIQKRIPLDFVLSTFMTAVRAQPRLMECSPSSLLGCILQAAQLDLSLLPTNGEAWMVPFNNKKTGRLESQFIVGYRGYIKRIYKVPNVAKVDAALVYENDIFEYEIGATGHFRHVPKVFGDRGKIIGGYSFVVFDNGQMVVNTMSIEKLEKIRSISKAKGAGPWLDWTSEMLLKSTFTGLNKKIPNLTREVNDMMTLQDKAVAGQAQEIDIDAIDMTTGELPPPAPIAEEVKSNSGVDVESSKNEEAVFVDAIREAKSQDDLRKILSLIDGKLADKKISKEQRDMLFGFLGNREEEIIQFQKNQAPPKETKKGKQGELLDGGNKS